MRIFVTGYNCSGKTHTAAVLAQALDVTSAGLDGILFADERAEVRNAEETRDAELASVIAEPNWIVEGRFLSWTESVRRSADLIICMKPSRLQMICRLVRRFAKLEPREPIANLLQYAISILRCTREWYPHFEREVRDVTAVVRYARNARSALEIAQTNRECIR